MPKFHCNKLGRDKGLENFKNEIIIELADVLEVIDGLCKAFNIDKKELMQVKKEKYKERGGFETGNILKWMKIILK